MKARWFLIFALAVLPGTAAYAACEIRQVETGLLNISKELGGTTYVDVMVGGDKACVTEKGEFEGRDWGYVAHKVDENNTEIAVEGWAPLRYLKSLSSNGGVERDEGADVSSSEECRRYLPLLDQTVSCEGTKTAARRTGDRASDEKSEGSGDETAALASERETELEAKKTVQSPPADEQQQTAANDRGNEDKELRYDQPVPFGPYPVNGLSIEQLIETVPLFSPLDGLPEDLWKKSCATCHKWNQERLCEQGKTYSKNARNVLRHQHPMGGSFKIALMKWSKSGCN